MDTCGKIKKMFSAVAKGFVCGRCIETIKGIVELDEKIAFCHLVKLVKSFCYLGDSLNTNGENEAAVTVKTRISWIDCVELLFKVKLSMKGGRKEGSIRVE